MIPQGHFESLHKMVFAQPGRAIFAVLDGAMVDGLPGRLALATPESACLFEGSLDPMLSANAPWLVRLTPGSTATRMVLQEGWNGHWGIVLATASDQDLRSVRAHLRRVLRVRAPDGKAMLFRFYDPRAFRTVIPTFDAQTRREFFGPIQGTWVESRAPDAALYFARDGKAEPQAMPLASVA